VIGKHSYPVNLLDDQLNSKLWIAMSKHLEKISIIALSPDKRYHNSTYGNIDLHLLPKFNGILGSFLFIILAVWTGLRLCIIGNIDLLEISEPTSGGVAGVVLKAVTGKKMLLHLQGELLNLQPGRFSFVKRKGIRFVTRIVCLFSDKIRGVSEKVMKQAIDAGIKEDKILTIASRCDTNLFSPDKWKESGEKLREELGYINNKIILFVGGLNASKGLKYALSALSEIYYKCPETIFLIVGEGELRGELEKLVTELNVSDVVDFYGSVPYTRVPEFLSIGDVFLQPSIDEGMPRSILEALSMELPVIATDVGGIPEIIKEGVTGILIDAQNPEQISKAVTSLLENYSFAKELGKNGRDLVVKSYSFDEGIQRLVDLHIDLVSPKSKRC
jgi:glycosyltransferase involved in cell wall biosynthesis